VCKNGPKGTQRRKKTKEESQFSKTFLRGKMTFWDVSSQVMKQGCTNTTGNDTAKCTMEDCQFPTTKIFPSVQMNIQNNVADFFFFDTRGIVHYEFVMNWTNSQPNLLFGSTGKVA